MTARHASRQAGFDAVGEREERVRRSHGADGALACVGDRDAGALDPAHLARADTHEGSVASEHDGVRRARAGRSRQAKVEVGRARPRPGRAGADDRPAGRVVGQRRPTRSTRTAPPALRTSSEGRSGAGARWCGPRRDAGRAPRPARDQRGSSKPAAMTTSRKMLARASASARVHATAHRDDPAEGAHGVGRERALPGRRQGRLRVPRRRGCRA